MVVIEYSQDCPAELVASCPVLAQPQVDLGGLPGSVNATTENGKITLRGPYEAINQFMLDSLRIKPGASNPYDISVKITASALDALLGTAVTDFDSFIIPVFSVCSLVIKLYLLASVFSGGMNVFSPLFFVCHIFFLDFEF